MPQTETAIHLPEVGWVIEHADSPAYKPVYWCGKHEWTDDNLKAVRFSRKDDADSTSEFIGFMEDETYQHRVAFHEWA